MLTLGLKLYKICLLTYKFLTDHKKLKCFDHNIRDVTEINLTNFFTKWVELFKDLQDLIKRIKSKRGEKIIRWKKLREHSYLELVQQISVIKFAKILEGDI